MAKERPVTAGGATADTRGREAVPPRPHGARTPPSPVAPGPRRPATGGPTDPRPIASPFLADPTGAPQTPAPQTPAPQDAAEPAGAPRRPAPQDAADPIGAPRTPAPQDAADPTAAAAPPTRQEVATSASPQQARQDAPAADAAPEAEQETADPARRPAPHPPSEGTQETSGERAQAIEQAQATAAPGERTATHPRPARTARPDLPSDDTPENPADQRDAPTRGVAKVPAPRPPWPGLQLQPMVHVADMPAAVAFYEKLGGDLVHGDRDGDWVLMQVGTAQIGLVTRPPDPARGESTVELNFSATMPLDRLERLLRERDVRIMRVAVDPDLGTRLHLETPDGMPIKIHQVEPDLLV